MSKKQRKSKNDIIFTHLVLDFVYSENL